MKKRILKGTILTVGAVAIISMVMLISSQFKPQPQIEFKEPTEETTEKEIIPEIPKEETLIPEIKEDEKVEDSIIEQELQPQIEIPEPTEDIPEEKPTEVPKEKPTENQIIKPTEKEEIEVPPITDIELNDLERIPPAPKPPKEPPKDGEVYFPGFGYIKDGGPNTEKIIDSDGDINKQVGEM